MAPTDLLVGLLILVGLAGIVVPVLPGTVLIFGAVLLWGIQTGSPAGWAVFGAATLLLVLGAVVKYVVPGRGLKAAGVPNRSLVAGGLLGIAGFFVIPVVGLFVGFVLGIYAAELGRVGRDLAWPSTKAALKAAGLSVLIELAAGLLATAVWAAGAVAV
ncbi:MAG: DUF456 domain-containing protein [Nocardioidaceae bacterium]|nr:DUF456 domain-containing protein [Nocardioidaceae bacterium]NUS51079.1 DUF456 domain-containing protein [Nocardioidaceae bacterium]